MATMSAAKQLVVVTDLDGTLLDASSYSADVAKPCVARCITAGVPVVACSSKTLSEQLPLRKDLGLEGQPFIVENGSAIITPQGYFTMAHIGQALCTCGFKVQMSKIQTPLTYEAFVLGTPVEEIRKALAELKKSVPCLKDLKTFTDLSVPELAELTGLPEEAAERAQKRDYSQTICSPLDEEMKEALHQELRKHGLTFACGGRFHTVTALGMDKGNAVSLLRSLLEVKLEAVTIIGLGDAENDRTMLQATDRAFLVCRPDGSHCDAADPSNTCTRVQGVGPKGWVEAVSMVLDGVDNKSSPWGGVPSTPKVKGRARGIPEGWACDTGVFDAKDFLRDLEQLRQRKKEMGVTVSFIFPTLEEEETIGYILQIVNNVREGLLDEVIVIDGNSKDRTVEIAEANGARVVLAPEVLPDWKYRGKGIQLWKSLLMSKGDICCWCDSDITNFTEVFVVGLVGPLLVDPDCRYVKAFYKRPLRTGDPAAGGASSGIGGRVTELLARPFINLYYPELHDIIQPLSGEFGGWRKDLERLSFMVQYGVETKLLLEFSRIFGADSIRQVNLHERCHRHQSLPALSKMSFLILQTFFTDMSERFHNPGMMQSMQSTTRIIRAGAANNDNVNKSRSTDRELASEQAAEGIISASLQEVSAKEIPLPPIVLQPSYLEAFYPGLTPCCAVLIALHEKEGTASKAVQEAASGLGSMLKAAKIGVAKVVADVSSPSGLPLRTAADLINSLPHDGKAPPQLDVVHLKPSGSIEEPISTRSSDLDASETQSMHSPASKKPLEVVSQLFAGLAYHKCAGDFDQGAVTSVVISDADVTKALYRVVYNVDYAKSFEDAAKGGQLCTAWRFDFLHAPAKEKLGGSVCGQSVRSGASATSIPPLTAQRLKSSGNGTVLGVQMRQLPTW